MIAAHSCKRDLILYRGVCDGVFQGMVKNAKDVPDCERMFQTVICMRKGSCVRLW